MMSRLAACFLCLFLSISSASADVSPISFFCAVSELADASEPKQVRLIIAAPNGVSSFSNAGSSYDADSKTASLYAAAPVESRTVVGGCFFLVEFETEIAVEPCREFKMVDAADAKSLTKELESQAKNFENQIRSRAAEINAMAAAIDALKIKVSDVEDINRLAILKDNVLAKKAEIDNLGRDKENLVQFLKLTESAPAPSAAETRAEELKSALQRLAEALRLKKEMPPETKSAPSGKSSN